MATKKKDMDPKLISSKQKWEPAALARKFKIKVADVRDAIYYPATSRSRATVEKRIKIGIEAGIYEVKARRARAETVLTGDAVLGKFGTISN